MGGKTELTTIKTLMEITGQNKEDVQNVLQKFGGDEDLAVSELMNSACLRVNEIFFFFFFFLVTLCEEKRAGVRISLVSSLRIHARLRPATDPIRAFSLKKKTVHKFVDVKTKKSKEVSVRFFGRRVWESGDRFRLFFFFSFCLLFVSAAVKSSSRVGKRERKVKFVKQRNVVALFFSPNEERERDRVTDPF